MPDCTPSPGVEKIGGVTASLVTYNNLADEVRSLLESLASSPRVTRIIAVDNSPADALRACIESAGAEYVHVPENIGFGAAHNRAMAQLIAESKYHLVVNPDIECDPTVIDSLFDFMEEHNEVGLTMPRVFYPDGREQHLCRLIPSPFDLFGRRFLGSRGMQLFLAQRERYELRHLDLSQPREIPYLSGCFMFLRSSALQEVGQFDSQFFMYLEDVDLCRRVGDRYKTVFYPFVSVTHGHSRDSYKKLRLLIYHVISAVRYFNKWGWIFDANRKKLNKRTDLY